MGQIKTGDPEVREQTVISVALFMSLFIIEGKTPAGKHKLLKIPLNAFMSFLNVWTWLGFYGIIQKTSGEAESYHNTISCSYCYIHLDNRADSIY